MSVRGHHAVEGYTLDRDDHRARGIFGGLNFILAGDPMQLPPVGGAPMWVERPCATGHTIEGRAVWLVMNSCVELIEVIRQQGAEQAAFRAMLKNIAEGRADLDKPNLLRTRMKSGVSEEEQELFRNADHLFSTNNLAGGEKKNALVSLEALMVSFGRLTPLTGLTTLVRTASGG